MIAATCVAVALPVLIGLASAWKARHDVQELHASHRILQIETANYRATIQALAAQIESLQSAVPKPGPSPETLPAAARLERKAAPAPAQTIEAGHAATGPGAAALEEALARSGRARSAADAENAHVLAGDSYWAAVSLERDAQALSAAGQPTDALVRAVEADARFRAAAIEARAHATSQPRGSGGDAPVSPAAEDTRAAPPEPASAMPLDASADVENAVRDVIAEYVTGLQSRSLATLRRVWPSLGGVQERAIQGEFENARSVEAVFTDPRITINGDTSTATGRRAYSLVTQDGQRLSRITTTTLTLRRSGDRWVIDNVAHQQ